MTALEQLLKEELEKEQRYSNELMMKLGKQEELFIEKLKENQSEFKKILNETLSSKHEIMTTKLATLQKNQKIIYDSLNELMEQLKGENTIYNAMETMMLQLGDEESLSVELQNLSKELKSLETISKSN